MANFKIAYDKTADFEGGYVNDPDDNGGETYKGIARNFWEKWQGWVIVDKYKQVAHNRAELGKILDGNAELQSFVEAFYKKNFWDEVRGDDITDQEVANNIYDFAVNSGVGRASRYAQRVVGAVEDGDIGNNSIKAINAYDAEMFVHAFKKAREGFYRKIVDNNPSQAKFLYGWLSRNANA